MALFGASNSFVGIDIGTSSLKLVELLNRRRRIEVTAYAQTSFPNPLTAQQVSDQTIKDTARVVRKMIDKSGVASDMAVVALPASSVFSTVVQLPPMEDKEMEKAVEFAARDVVPADLSEVILGYSRLGDTPHMKTDAQLENQVQAAANSVAGKDGEPVPVFITAAPKFLVNRYVTLVDQLKLRLLALELETFPLVRSLLAGGAPSAMIVDIGDLATTFHIIDAGTPRVSHTIEFGGHDITDAIAQKLSVTPEEAEEIKSTKGLVASPVGKEDVIVKEAVGQQVAKAKDVLALYKRQSGRTISQTVLIGGGANLPGLADFWSKQVEHRTSIGNPWKGLSYPDALEKKLRYLGPTYGVAVGLALRGFTQST